MTRTKIAADFPSGARIGLSTRLLLTFALSLLAPAMATAEAPTAPIAKADASDRAAASASGAASETDDAAASEASQPANPPAAPIAKAIPLAADAGAPELFAAHCASCHGQDRLGISGPALLPVNLGRLKPAAARELIKAGGPATQMPSFSEALTDEQIERVVAWIFTDPPELPTWGPVEIVRSHRLGPAKHPVTGEPVVPKDLPPVADPLNLFVVVEAGDHAVTILDGDRLEPVTRFPTRFALHGGAKFSPDGRYTYLASRDGWVSMIDLRSMTQVAEVRVAVNTRNIAVSADGRYVLAGNGLPQSLVLLDARDLSLVQVVPAMAADGTPSRVSAVYAIPPRGSFVAALRDVPELLEIPLPVVEGGGHPLFGHGPFSEEQRRATTVAQIRHVPLEAVLDDFLFDDDCRFVVGADRAGGGGRVIELATGKPVARIDIPGMPHLGSGVSWSTGSRRVVGTPNLAEGLLTILDTSTWEIVKQIETEGPGFFVRSHEKSRYVWADVFFGPNQDAVHVIDKETLEIVRTFRPAPGKVAAHVEFDRDGRYVLLSIWDLDGALVVYDAETLEEIKRIPMKKPVGKYNVSVKIGVMQP